MQKIGAFLVLVVIACSGDGAPPSDREPGRSVAAPSFPGRDSVLRQALATPELAVEYRWIDASRAGAGEHRDPMTGEAVSVGSSAVLALDDIDSVRVAEFGGDAESPLAIVTVKVNFAAAQRFLSATSANRGERIAVLFNGKVVESAQVETPMASGLPLLVSVPRPLADSVAARIRQVLAERASPRGAS